MNPNEVFTFTSNTRCIESMCRKLQSSHENNEEDLSKWRNIPSSWDRMLDTVRKPILPNWSNRFHASPVRTPVNYCAGCRHAESEVHMERQ